MKILTAYLYAINLTSFLTFGYDKYLSKQVKKRRIPEKRLHLLTLLGGSPGSCLGMIIFSHKTKKVKFVMITLSFMALHWVILRYLPVNLL
jgi:uncharacterized membrane protein YsdA (DUF1294 family)